MSDPLQLARALEAEGHESEAAAEAARVGREAIAAMGAALGIDQD